MNNLFHKDLQVRIEGGQAVVDTRCIARVFGKRHDHVLRDVQNEINALGNISVEELNAIAEATDAQDDVSGLPNFGESSYKKQSNGSRREYPMYTMNRDGFMLLVMGYTGQKARICKLHFIAAFKEMENKIRDLTERKANAFDARNPRLAVVIQHPDMSRQALAELLGYKSLDSVTRARRRARELGLLGEQS